MSLNKQTPAHRQAQRVSEPFGAFSGFFDDLFASHFWPASSAQGGAAVPRVDIVDQDNSYVIKAELPGVKKEDIEITVHEDILTLKAVSRSEYEASDKAHNLVHQERRYGEFLRRFSLRENVSQEDICADYTDGILTLTLPKAEPRTPQPTKVEIR